LAVAVGPSGQVFAFEALPANIKRARANLDLNPDLIQINLLPLAVTDQPGTVQFHVHTDSNSMGKVAGSGGRNDGYAEEIAIPATSLDAFVYQEGHPAPAVIKLDIEGGEVLAMQGMKHVLVEARPVMLVELHGPEAAQVVWKTLTQSGYTLHQMTRGYPQILSLEDLDWKAYLVGKPTA
jgi:FkbM family methyltransferase